MMGRTPGGCTCAPCAVIVRHLVAQQLASVAPSMRLLICLEAMQLADLSHRNDSDSLSHTGEQQWAPSTKL